MSQCISKNFISVSLPYTKLVEVARRLTVYVEEQKDVDRYNDNKEVLRTTIVFVDGSWMCVDRPLSGGESWHAYALNHTNA